MQNNTFSGETERPRLIVFDEIDSTNDYFKSDLANFKPHPEWSAIMAKKQTAGRGQRGNKWLSEEGKNLTFSFLIYPSFISLNDQFILNALISLSLLEWLNTQELQASIKWPNDLYVGQRKLGGILIENRGRNQQISQSIVGIGLNINQTTFPEEIKNSCTSLSLEKKGQQTDLQEICNEILDRIKAKYQSFKEGKLPVDELLETYNAHLYRRHIWADFKKENGDIFKGYITGVSRDGLLNMQLTSQEFASFRLKEIQFLTVL